MAELPHRAEDYLRTIHDIVATGEPATLTRVAWLLHRSVPTVSETLRRLVADGQLRRTGHAFDLTATGSSIASAAAQRHQLATRLLTAVVGLSPSEANREADRWVHAISNEVQGRLADLFGTTRSWLADEFAFADAAQGPPREPVPLSEMALGNASRVTGIADHETLDPESHRYLIENGLTPGSSLYLHTQAPDGVLLVYVGGRPIALGRGLNERVLVVPLSGSDSPGRLNSIFQGAN